MIESKKSGFTLIEIVIAFIIMGLILAVALPRFGQQSPRHERKKFITQLNSLAQSALQHTFVTRTMHKVVINLEQRRAWIEFSPSNNVDERGNMYFERLTRWHAPTEMVIPSYLKMKSFIVGGSEQVQRSINRATIEFYFLIGPDGIAQEVTMTLIDSRRQRDRPDASMPPISLILSPFRVQFDESSD